MNKNDSNVIAAVDLGSNSFHLTLAKMEHNNLHIVGKLKERVKLAAGLDENMFLDEASQQRGLKCLELFRSRLQDMPIERVKAVGTHSLRKAKNANEFIAKAEKVLGYPIEVISGKEEARLIFSGVAHFQGNHQKQLIIDIGGGSTEFVIGESYDSLLLDSLQMGCVSYAEQFFQNGIISKENFKKAITAARLELISIQDLYLREGWERAIGTSGTIECVMAILKAKNRSKSEIHYADLIELKNTLIQFETVSAIEIPGLPAIRKEILPSGLSILIAAFKSLDISSLETSPAALREGLIFELTGRERYFDIRERAINGLLTRYHIDRDQARRVNQTAATLLEHVKEDWKLDDDYFRQLLSWASRCHEIGLSINYNRHQKHGEYILLNTDIGGFSIQQQRILSLLVRVFRRKFSIQLFDAIADVDLKLKLIRTARILRIAVLLNHRRRDHSVARVHLNVVGDEMDVVFEKNYLTKHPLTIADLRQEQNFIRQAGLELTFQ